MAALIIDKTGDVRLKQTLAALSGLIRVMGALLGHQQLHGSLIRACSDLSSLRTNFDSPSRARSDLQLAGIDHFLTYWNCHLQL